MRAKYPDIVCIYKGVESIEFRLSSRELFYLIVLFVVGRVDFQVSNIVIEIFQVWNFRKILEK